ncbi:hypothetical protein NBH81_03550 [Aeromonas veronii]|uniref:hypothetical protein n=1 Tax=Aeromonas veronii TaxID=654 RepID=UPI0021DA6E65|nr:hypothetical protein [Aeromonas veronii]UYB71586.1 hypothetical protein NBH81_03550 [Aeromonas veronii]
MSNLYEIAEAIMDSAAAEYRDENLATAAAVEDYAFNAMGVAIATEQAELIRSTLQDYIDSDASSSNDWHHMVKVKLAGE